MPTVALRRAFTTGTAIGAVLAVTVAGSAWPCTPEQYMSAEERASGQYDFSSPDYAQDWGGAPHTHDAPAPAAQPEPAPPASAGAPQPASNGAQQRTTGRAPVERRDATRTASRAQRSATAQAPTAAPATPPPSPVQPAAVQPQHTAHPAAPAAPPRRRSTPRPRRETTAAKRPAAPTGHPAVRESQTPAASPAPVIERVRPATLPVRRDDAPLLALTLLLGLGLAAAIWRRRSGERSTVRPPDGLLAFDDAAIEAELQQLLADERARTQRERVTPPL